MENHVERVETMSHLYLYSINTYLAYRINEEYYSGCHYVWCSPGFDLQSNPPSSNPIQIYRTYKEDVDKRDLHSDAITRNRSGLQKGIKANYLCGRITESQRKELNDMVKKADISDFRPMIYVISLRNVEDSLVRAGLDRRAALFSKEYQIYELKNTDFEAFEV